MLADRSINHQHSREYRYYGAQSVIPMTEEWDSSLSIECGQRTLLSLYKYTLTRTRTLKAVEGKVEGGGREGALTSVVLAAKKTPVIRQRRRRSIYYVKLRSRARSPFLSALPLSFSLSHSITLPALYPSISLPLLRSFSFPIRHREKCGGRATICNIKNSPCTFARARVCVLHEGVTEGAFKLPRTCAFVKLKFNESRGCSAFIKQTSASLNFIKPSHHHPLVKKMKSI